MEPICLGLLGLNFGEGIAKQLVKHGTMIRLKAVCDLDEARAKRVGETIGVEALTLDAMLADPEIEAIGLFTGPVERMGLLDKILKSGRHVITTKPFGLESTSSEKVLRLAQEKGLTVHLNSPGPKWAYDQVTIERLREERELGRPVAFHAQTWAHYREKANGTWYDDPAKCPAAPILRLGVYFLNDFAPMVGQPEQIHVMESRLFTERPTSDQAQISIRFTNGAIGSVFASFCVQDGQSYRDSLTINYENGTIQRWMVRNFGLTMEEDYAMVTVQTKWCGLETFQMPPGDFAGWYHWKTFQEAVRNKKGTTDSEIESILYGVRFLEATRESSKTGLPVQVSAGVSK